MPVQTSNIVWTDTTANHWAGCAKTSEGCQHCWAEDLAMRFDRTDDEWTVADAEDNLEVYDEDFAAEMASLSCPQWVFTPSASDPCLPWLPEAARDEWLAAIEANPQHCYQVLTKWGAEERGLDLPDLPENVILGVTCESPRRRYRLDWLREQDVGMRFVSFEPLVEPIPDVDLSGIDWIIVGGESHRNADARRDMDPAWAVDLYEEAREQDVAFLFKQHSGAYPEADRHLNVGDFRQRTFNEFPETPAGVPDAPLEFLEVSDGD